MKSKIFGICLLVFICLFGVFAGEWFMLYGNQAMMVMHCVFASMFFGYLPALIFRSEEYRLLGYVMEILFGFVVFIQLYLNCTAENDSHCVITWLELFMYDSIGVMAVGFIGAMRYAGSTKH